MKQRTYTFSKNAKTGGGALFWSAPKRFPKPLEFNSNDPNISAVVEKARLRFSHAETIILFTCLLGLFLSVSDIEKIQRE